MRSRPGTWRRPDRWALELPRREGHEVGARAAPQGDPGLHRMGRSRSQLQSGGRSRSREMHRLQPVLRGVPRHCGELHPQRRRCARARARGADQIDGLSNYLDEKGMKSVRELHRKAIPAFTEWGDLDLNYKVVAEVDPAKCIGCNLCYVACRDTAVNCIHNAGDALAPGHVAPTRSMGSRTTSTRRA